LASHAKEIHLVKTIEVVAAVIKNKATILAAQRGQGEFVGGWEFPGGKIEQGETPEEALSREILEELKLEIRVHQRIITVNHQYDEFRLIMHCYLCTATNEELTLVEHNAIRWLDAERLDEVDWLPADRPVIQAILDQHIL
jgi:8-oxo-dGTP diphosphatase